MKGVLLVSLFSLTSLAQAADWKVVAESVDCPEKVRVLAKEGESYVIASHDNTQRKLYSRDGSAWSDQSPRAMEFSSDEKKEKYLLGDPTFTFTQPSVVERNPPKVDVFFSGRKAHCRMNAK